VSGHLRNRREAWREPVYRDVWGLLGAGLGDAGLAALVAPRGLVVEAVPGPEVAGPPSGVPSPGVLSAGSIVPAPPEEVRAEVERARSAYARLGQAERIVRVAPAAGQGAGQGPGPGPGTDEALGAFLRLLGAGGADGPVRDGRPGGRQCGQGAGAAAPAAAGAAPAPAAGAAEGAEAGPGAGERPGTTGPGPGTEAGPGTGPGPGAGPQGPPPAGPAPGPDPEARQRRQFRQVCDHVQRLLGESDARRRAYWAAADPSSPEAWAASCAPYRTRLHAEVLGRCPPAGLPANPRTRLVYDRPAWRGYEVALDLWPGVFAYGILLLPTDLAPGERRPAVVCQHGLEGRARDVIEGPPESPYRAYAARLAERGYVVYAPQNPYIGGEGFRVLQRKAHPLQLSLFSFIVAQHARTLEWLAGLECVDPARIALYGLSYGGKTAMRVPAVLPGYCLSICSADFNEWVRKCAGEDRRFSYLFTIEYDMYEFDLGHTCGYAEMAGLIAPRPFMVERGHRDAVGVDEWVAFEYAKVRRRYSDLGIAERTEIEFFEGGHWIRGEGTFAFLERHLGPPRGAE
jgi:hypothetical protein